MKQTVSIHRATPSDTEIVSTLITKYLEFYNRSASSAQVRRFIAARLHDNDSAIFLARIARTQGPAGVMQLYPSYSTVSLQKIWILNDLYVTDNRRKQGIGRALIDHAIDFARADGAVRLDLTTQHENNNARQLYEKIGFFKDELFLHYQYLLSNGYHPN